MGLPATPVEGSPASAPANVDGSAGRTRTYPWLVFAVIFALLLSDYMSRQVLSAVFPILKEDWGLSDSKLASLNSVVALMVGILAFPLSLLADRWGRIKSLILMATIWSVATLLCALAASYEQMLAARFFVGVGEAAYSSVGLALLLTVFPHRLRASLSGTFLSGASYGSVIGVALGGAIAVHLGWRWSFASMAVLGLVLVALFRIVVTERRLAIHRYDDAATEDAEPAGDRPPLRTLVSNPALVLAYLGSGLQMFVQAVLILWLPSYFNRYYSMAPDKAGLTAAAFIVLIGVGMTVCGIVSDRISAGHPGRKWTIAATICALSAALLLTGFSVGHGALQLTLLGVGSFFSAGATGAVTALVVELSHPGLRASALGVGILGNNIFGIALGPLVAGIVADRFGLDVALQLTPLIYIAAIAALVVGRRAYPAGLRRLANHTAPDAVNTESEKQ
ncbi:MFS transporter [Prescottella defluvii]|nr:MFS transporter [Prescottella defluvii]